jgi:hypothetical protein
VRLFRHITRPFLLAAIAATLLSCATVQEKTESYLFAEPELLAPPIDAWLRTVEVVSNSLPMSEDYALIGDSFIAIASKHGFQLSLTRAHQPYAVDLVLHERSSVIDLSTRNSVMAVMNVSTSSESPAGVARVVHSAVSSDSIVSLYLVIEVGEKVFGSLRAAVDERIQKAKDAAKAKPVVASTP